MRVVMLPILFLLAGCLTTTKPVLNEGNAVLAENSPAFVAFVDAWKPLPGTKIRPGQ